MYHIVGIPIKQHLETCLYSITTINSSNSVNVLQGVSPITPTYMLKGIMILLAKGKYNNWIKPKGKQIQANKIAISYP